MGLLAGQQWRHGPLVDRHRPGWQREEEEAGTDGERNMGTQAATVGNRQPVGICCMTRNSNPGSVTTQRGVMGWEGERGSGKGTYVYL